MVIGGSFGAPRFGATIWSDVLKPSLEFSVNLHAERVEHVGDVVRE